MLGQLFDKPGSEKGLTVKKAVQLQNNYKEKQKKSKTEPTVTGSTETTTQKGAKKSSPPRRNKGTITYPANAAQDRDYLCIKAIEYITPQSRGKGKEFGEGGGLQVKTNEIQTAINKKTKEQVAISGSGGLAWKFGAGSSQRSKKAKKTLYTVNLPIPQQVSDNLGVTWGESTMHLFELAGLQVAQDFMESPAKAMSEYAAQVKATMEDGSEGGLGLSQEVQKSFQAALSGTALNSLGSNVTASQVISRSTGQVLNSNRELIFEGVQLRTFPFNIQFSPRDAAEAAIVLEIIRNFKQSMSPKKGEGAGALGGKGATSSGGAFIKAPDVFLLEYRKGGQKHPFLNSFKVCALTSMSVNYTGAGTYATYSDSTPIKVTVDLSFKELEPIYNDDYAEVAEGVGY